MISFLSSALNLSSIIRLVRSFQVSVAWINQHKKLTTCTNL
jgi:hypothetical protein